MPLHFSILAPGLGSDPTHVLRLSRSLGFAGVLFPLRSPLIDLTELSLTGRREFRHFLAADGQTLVALDIAAGPKGLLPGADNPHARIEPRNGILDAPPHRSVTVASSAGYITRSIRISTHECPASTCPYCSTIRLIRSSFCAGLTSA
jgi:hypothetical protein